MKAFVKNQTYKRQEIWSTVVGSDQKMSRNFQQSGYERIDEQLFAFINIGYKGNADQIFPNTYDEVTETLMWYGKKKTHSSQPLMRSIIDGSLQVQCFARWNSEPKFRYLGIGKVINFTDNFSEVFEINGERTYCIQFELNCRDDLISPGLINNFDQAYEEIVSEEGAEKYVTHKTRERGSEIVEAKKSEYRAKFGRLRCEVCEFDFEAVYGERGSGFIECHHNVPLHETDGITKTRLSDLTLLCSNCHRMIHRKKDWLTVEQLRLLLK
jgi:hypothetical protein